MRRGGLLASKEVGPPRSSSVWCLQLVVDRAEDPRDAVTERVQDADRRNRDQGEQERVLHESLPILAIPQGRNREVGPHGERMKLLHLCPPYEGRRLSRRAPVVQGWRPALACGISRSRNALVAPGDRPFGARNLLREGWDDPVLRSKALDYAAFA